jgi:hypothetical protein
VGGNRADGSLMPSSFHARQPRAGATRRLLAVGYWSSLRPQNSVGFR